MKDSIPFYVIRYLDLYPELHLAGLGTFIRMQNPAVVSLEEETVSPPSQNTNFNPGDSKRSDRFALFLEYQTGQPKKACTKSVRSFVNSILRKLKNETTASIPNLGDFKITDQEQIIFLPDKEMENARYMYFQSVPLPFQSISEVTPEDSANSVPIAAIIGEDTLAQQTDVEESEKRQPDPDIEVVETPQDNTRVEPVGMLLVEEEPIASAAKVTSAAMETQKLHKTVDPLTIREPDILETKRERRNYIGWFLWSVVLFLVVWSLLFINNLKSPGIPAVVDTVSPQETVEAPAESEPQFAEAELHTVEEHQSEPTDEIIQESELSQDQTGQTKLQTTDHTITTQTAESAPVSLEFDCMIVVGAFAEQANVLRMQERLVSLGFEPYTMQRGRLTHVGILKACRSSDLRSALYQLRSDIEQSAWVLRVSGQPPVKN